MNDNANIYNIVAIVIVYCVVYGVVYDVVYYVDVDYGVGASSLYLLFVLYIVLFVVTVHIPSLFLSLLHMMCIWC